MIERVLFRCTPARRTRGASVNAALLMGGGLVLWLAAPRLSWSALLRAAAAVLICTGLYIAVRFVFHGYTYTLEQHGDGRVDFTVVEQSGRRQVTVCRIDCAEIVQMQTLGRGQKPPKPGPGRQVYHYCAEFRPSALTVLTVRNADGESSIRISADPALNAAIAARLAEKEILDGFSKNS